MTALGLVTVLVVVMGLMVAIVLVRKFHDDDQWKP
jgi:hypothetical protein